MNIHQRHFFNFGINNALLSLGQSIFHVSLYKKKKKKKQQKQKFLTGWIFIKDTLISQKLWTFCLAFFQFNKRFVNAPEPAIQSLISDGPQLRVERM